MGLGLGLGLGFGLGLGLGLGFRSVRCRRCVGGPFGGAASLLSGGGRGLEVVTDSGPVAAHRIAVQVL
ncbi:hypothetical protein [Frankia sp. AgPm24]|uniref:hypothetical protein n=1 Tax=Frankia sp. AgPm24 TaxID=631128 RepID=UPI0035AF90C7